MSRLDPPGLPSENEGDGELGGRVMELIRLGPLSILRWIGWGREFEEEIIRKKQSVKNASSAVIECYEAQLTADWQRRLGMRAGCSVIGWACLGPILLRFPPLQHCNLADESTTRSLN